MLKLKATIKHRFELHLSVEELNNIPQLSGNAYCKLTISNHNRSVKFQDFSRHVEIKHNKSHLDYTLVRPFKVYQDVKRNTLLNLDLLLEFFSDLGHNKNKLGTLKINLCDFLQYDSHHTVRYLLQESKINSILKISIHWTPVATPGPNVTTAPSALQPAAAAALHPSALASRTSLSNSSTNVSKPIDADDESAETKNKVQKRVTLSSPLNPQNSPSSTQQQRIPDPEETAIPQSPSEQQQKQQKLDVTTAEASCLAAGRAITDEKILRIIDKSFQVPWNCEFAEYSPAEAVDDIFDHNGLGFKRNEEGMLLVDLYADKKAGKIADLDRAGVIGNSSRAMHGTDSPEFMSSSSDESDSDGEVAVWSGDESGRSHWRSKASMHRRNKGSRQVDEKEIRPDLKSWVIN